MDHDQAIDRKNLLTRTLLAVIRDAFFSAERVQAYADHCWLLRGVVNVERRGSIHLFHFTVEEDLDNVVLRSPFNINGALLVLQHWTPNLVFQNFEISHIKLWVQGHGIPGEWRVLH
ncbi:hypothetical protein LIER_43831 [Lithospermum erythrorhizon]|uniref:DUF4283 domain-containing protein n=1 Tax=Lithospermum erythrorhizon TaxID=34254 RepID=A0AAV3R3J4_LITER